jgi:hypothetical protein
MVPTIDPRAYSSPGGVEVPLVNGKEDLKWRSSGEAAFREQAFHVYYDRSFAAERDLTRRFIKALAASCRPFIRPGLVPQIQTPSLGQTPGVLAQATLPAKALIVRAEAPRRPDAYGEQSTIAIVK